VRADHPGTGAPIDAKPDTRRLAQAGHKRANVASHTRAFVALPTQLSPVEGDSQVSRRYRP